MNWITNFVRPRINSVFGRRAIPENLWVKCPETGAMVYHKDLKENQWVISSSDFHMKIPAKERLKFLFDNAKYCLLDQPQVCQDPLKFRDNKKYIDRLKENRSKTGLIDSIVSAVGNVRDFKLVAVVHEFSFIGGSIGIAAGEAIVKSCERAIAEKCPLVMFTASGGARMQEGILSLMQLPRTTIAINMLKDAGLPYIVVLTNPTTGGVTASYAMLGDIHLAEPGAEIGFAGRRVIEQTVREKLPDGFQRSEYLVEHGMIDRIVHRHDIPEVVSSLCKILTKSVQ
ncbi:acetyl-CoA carboxylase, carboxyltransferase subunit beta [Candidatus Liberibacter asiaticus]|uniref:Acetyl-coenzyme A carboxylase carboxyl transferase subunit beta n=2 Tax=Liberibacter asiaticus TaxID=34021 RepID=ACCD_LIBAP|nr:acetyl-CoA carboxylase, carboxyltransferase subunit beta [Candidatus Liberibacter asiaticus]C6XFZ0.1 RecName: Full=Acetyl-coenzyme A carboxylase carboxyl transferase subunit beta; Short=ACCase subunit beta; Short=Acetyl-CoA carboxylase carboxyltransferase subunit beta [Candidatus Liberibacter asiaticus str. psy62]ACT57293.1 acetyl-CoA carboxylase subunit beta [Candidatus Liberibacter asiaticus str. psy62]AGH16742.1 acetyl-CoA carboxylase subunit beta [Candidatus Liberibacter asiaticus str. gx